MACYVLTHRHWLSITEHKDTLNCSLKITISWPLITWIIPATAGFFPVTCQRTRLIIRGWINITNWEKQTLFSSLRMDGINQPCRTRSLSFCGTNTTGRDSVWCDINTMKHILCIPVIYSRHMDKDHDYIRFRFENLHFFFLYQRHWCVSHIYETWYLSKSFRIFKIRMHNPPSI